MNPASGNLVVVALSGGVDSAVAALLLLRAGYRVEALHMTNWEEADGWCTAGDDHAAARQVASQLSIPLHHVRFEQEYRDRVFADFLAQYRAGRTPNPDIGCNRHIKFGAMLAHAQRLGADWLATGHYARVRHDPGPALLRAIDENKDQTYFLHAIEPEALRHVLFPLGMLPKQEVRRIAAEAGLANHARPDSTGICFIGERPFREFLARWVSAEPGPILSATGEQLGEHVGLPYYTLGQRQGLNIGGQAGAAAAPWYVAAKDPARNALVAVQDPGHPLLMSRAVITRRPRWLGAAPDPGRRDWLARIRHRQALVRCELAPAAGGGIEVRFARPVRAATPGQSVVLYEDERCAGGGEIDIALPANGTSTAALPGSATA
jgi:tRNA-uridine 2-sulfurtransferase